MQLRCPRTRQTAPRLVTSAAVAQAPNGANGRFFRVGVIQNEFYGQICAAAVNRIPTKLNYRYSYFTYRTVHRK